jgi:hypothetical protein
LDPPSRTFKVQSAKFEVRVKVYAESLPTLLLTSHFVLCTFTLNFVLCTSNFLQNVSLNPNCTVRGAYERLGLDTGCPYPGLLSVTLYIE